MRTSNFSPNHPAAKARGWAAANRAASALPTVSDGVNEVTNASEIVIVGGQVSEPEDGVAQISFGGLSQSSNTAGGGANSAGTPVYMRNNASVDLTVGNVVVVDPTADSAVTTTATASNTQLVGVVQGPIAKLAYGPVLFNGFASEIDTVGTVSRGNYALTSATAGKAGATAARVAGSFAEYLTGTDLPDAVIAATNTEQGTPSTTLAINMPAVIPTGRVLFLGLWLDASASAPTIAGWTRIGSTSGFYYFYRISTGDDTATATWTGASVATATALLLNQNVSIASPVGSSAYDATTAAATVTGLSDSPRYAIAGVQANVASPGGGFARLGGGTAGFSSSGGAPALVQSAEGDAAGVSFASPVTNGNVVVAIPIKSNATDTWSTDARQGGTCPVDSNMVQIARGVDTGATPGFVATGIMAKVAGDTYAGPYGTDAACDASAGYLLLAEFSHLGVSSYQVATQDAGTSSTVDPNGGPFTVGADDVTIMTIAFRSDDNHDPLVSVNGFTQLFDGAGFALWWWVGYKIGNGDASVTLGDTSANQHWGAAAAVLTGGSSSSAGTLAGKYIAHASSATSPFTGASQQNDAIFVLNLQQDAKASALLYGPDLGTGASTSIVDAGGYFTGTDVEAVLQELASKDIGYQAHGNMGSTETFSALIGWHSGTFNADCTLTFSGATSGLVASIVLELLEDGTGGWQPTWPGSVVWPGGTPPTHDDTLGSTTLYLFQSRDGGTTWYGFQAGGGSSVAALDDLSDVTITTPVTTDRLRFDGSVWRNSALIWYPLTVNDGTYWLPLVDGDGNSIMAEA